MHVSAVTIFTATEDDYLYVKCKCKAGTTRELRNVEVCLNGIPGEVSNANWSVISFTFVYDRFNCKKTTATNTFVGLSLYSK